MKKHFLKSFALLAMLFSALTISAKQYCGEVMKSNIGWDGNYTLSVDLFIKDMEKLVMKGVIVSLDRKFADVMSDDYQTFVTMATNLLEGDDN